MDVKIKVHINLKKEIYTVLDLPYKKNKVSEMFGQEQEIKVDSVFIISEKKVIKILFKV